MGDTLGESKTNKLEKIEKTKHDINSTGVQYPILLVFTLATLITGVILELWTTEISFWKTVSVKEVQEKSNTFAIYSNSKDESHLIHILSLLQQFGYHRVTIDEDWKLLWAHDYPFLKMPQKMKNLKSHQIVNHFPGSGFITNKVDLSTTNLPFLPRAFRLPNQSSEFKIYSESNPQSLFVQKHNEHRHIVIKSPADINLNTNETFIQEYIQNPLLVDGYKFDIGIYVAITSVKPLRIYIYKGDVLFRYCPIKYYPFDSKIIDKYVVGDDYLPTWNVSSLKKYYNEFSGSMRGAFDAYVRELGRDPTVIWEQVEDIIRQTILTKEMDIIKILNSYKTKNFFELMRFDLIIDDNMHVYLMEANMSPNLSSAHFQPNALLYEQVLYSVFNLLGIGTPFNKSSDDGTIITADKNIATHLNYCSKHKCDKFCNKIECDLCLPCLSGSQIRILKAAHREHLHKVDMKRIFPKPILDLKAFNISKETQNLTDINGWMVRWFYGMCQYERSWCL